MKRLKFPEPFKHKHPQVQNVNLVFEEQLTLGQRAADGVAQAMGSWKFIIIQSIIILFWILFNVMAWIQRWDPYPFILMNLVLSLQAAYAAPIIMMSQNRQAAKDRLEVHNDFLIDQKAEQEVKTILEHLEAQNIAIEQIYHLLLAQQPPEKN